LEFSFLCESLKNGEARPGLSGALFLFARFGLCAGSKKKKAGTEDG